ncbi:MAG TPA: ANTAR domain-containing protein [Gemmataceae bacterium]|nr:ANTAR domain-containing protein [Gemmataceae bacterium]
MQRRLKDRIVIKRAKGILIQQLGITEEESYRRLRLLARRQQKPIRAVAQSVLEMHALLSSDNAAASTREERKSPARHLPLKCTGFRPDLGPAPKPGDGVPTGVKQEGIGG